MRALVPWIVLALSAALLFVRDKQASDRPLSRDWVPAVAGLALSLALGVIATVWKPEYSNTIVWLAMGSALASVSGRLSGLFDKRSFGGRTIALGMAAAGVLLAFRFGPGPVVAALSFAIGAAVTAGAWTLSGEGEDAALTAVIAFVASIASGLGLLGIGGDAAGAGTMLAAAGLVSAVIGVVVAKTSKPAIGSAVAVGLFLVAAWLLALRFFYVRDLAVIVTVAVAASVLTAWVLPTDREPSKYAYALGALMFLGIATVAFSLRLGLGMGVASIGVVVAALLLNNPKVIVAASPLIALAAFRLFREQNPESIRVFDIGQHYGLVGLLMGVLAVVALAEGSERFQAIEGPKRWMASSAAALALMAAVMGSVVILAAKGTIGLAIGIGLAPVFAAWAGRASLGVVAFAMGLNALLILGYGNLGPLSELPRSERTTLLVGTLILAASLAAASWWLSQAEPQAKEREA